MATARLSDLVTRLGRRSGPPDPDLLGRFLAGRDEQAFAALVARHGPMVFGVCRRVAGDHHLAEDAFQAVFVVLAAKAAAVRPRSALPGWLYGVAYRTALRARTMSDRRRRREAQVETLPEPAAADPDPVEAADVAAVLDAEVARLPDHLRLAVVLCELEGRSRADAAGQLGIAEGTLSSRLAAARKALAARLRQRGIALSAAALTAALGRVASAHVPADLTARAVSAALSPTLVPATVAVLSHGVLRIMFAQKLKSVPAVLGLVAAVAFAGGLLPAAHPPAAHEPLPKPALVLADAPKPAAPAAAPKPLPKGSNKILFWRDGTLALIGPDGKNEKRVGEGEQKYHASGARLSPDGKTLAFLHQAEVGPLPSPRIGAQKAVMKLHVRGVHEKGPGTALGVECQTFVWSPDGTGIAYTDFTDGPEGITSATHGTVNVKTKETTALKLPADHVITDWSRDGKFFLTTRNGGKGEDREVRVYLMNRDGTEHKALTDPKTRALFGRFSPDGKRVLYLELPVSKDKKVSRTLVVADVAAGKVTPVEDVPLNADVQGYCWSPDGKRLAYTWRQLHEGDPKDVAARETESFLVVCDADGRNQKTIATEKRAGQWFLTLGAVDWGFVADDEAGEGAKTDEEKIQGTWKFVSVVEDGKRVDPAGGQVIFGRGKITLKGGGGANAGTFKLDRTRNQKWIDVTMDEEANVPPADGPQRGIYELDGDTLKLCFDTSGKRPTEFVSKAGTNHLLMVLEREKK